MTTKANGGKPSNPEVFERATRHRFSAEYKLGILEEADRCALSEQGALLRREGLHYSHLVKLGANSDQKGAMAALFMITVSSSKFTHPESQLRRHFTYYAERIRDTSQLMVFCERESIARKWTPTS